MMPVVAQLRVPFNPGKLSNPAEPQHFGSRKGSTPATPLAHHDRPQLMGQQIDHQVDSDATALRLKCSTASSRQP